MSKLFLVFIAIACAGCNGFNQSTSVLPNGALNEGQSSDPNNVNYKLVVNGGPYYGLTVLNNIENSRIKFQIPLGTNKFVPVGSFSSEKWSVTGQTTENSSGQKFMEVQVPLDLVSQGVNSPTATTLPNGDPLSFISSGVAEHFSFPLENATDVVVHVYMSPPSRVGVFVQTAFDLGEQKVYQVVLDGGLIDKGFISTHLHHSPLNGGTFVFISLPQ